MRELSKQAAGCGRESSALLSVDREGGINGGKRWRCGSERRVKDRKGEGYKED